MIDINTEIAAAIRDKQPTRLAVLRQLKTAIETLLSSKGRNGKALTADEEISLIRKQVAQRDESIALYKQANRTEQADIEGREKKILESFLPEGMSPEAIAVMVDLVLIETGATARKDMGRAITRAKELAAGRVDPKVLSQLIAAKLQ